MVILSSSSASLKILVEKEGHASCIVTMADGCCVLSECDIYYVPLRLFING